MADLYTEHDLTQEMVRGLACIYRFEHPGTCLVQRLSEKDLCINNDELTPGMTKAGLQALREARAEGWS